MKDLNMEMNIIKVGDYVEIDDYQLTRPKEEFVGDKVQKGRVYHVVKEQYLNIVTGETVEKELYQVLVFDGDSVSCTLDNMKLVDVKTTDMLVLKDFPNRPFEYGQTLWFEYKFEYDDVELMSGEVYGYTREYVDGVETIFIRIVLESGKLFDITEDEVTGYEPIKG